MFSSSQQRYSQLASSDPSSSSVAPLANGGTFNTLNLGSTSSLSHHTITLSSSSSNTSSSASTGLSSTFPPPPLLSSNSSQPWDSLRRQAKQLETEIEVKLTVFAKIGASVSTASVTAASSSSSAAPGGSASSDPWTQADSTQRDLDELMKRLTATVNAMATFLENQPSASLNPSMMHMLQRHRDILYDYSKELKRTKSNISATREHAELMSGRANTSDTYRNMGMQDYMLNERIKIDSSHSMADQVLEQAYETRDQLDSQRRMLANAQSRLGGALTRIPMINNVISKIKTKKQRDTILVAVVIGVCVCILLFFYFR